MSTGTLRMFTGGVLVALTAAFSLPAIAQTSEGPLLPTGTLVRTFSDPKVYYIQHTQKRWVESEEAFLAQGFTWPRIVYIPDADIERYEDGLPVTPESLIILPSERPMLPDLLPFAAEDVRVVREEGRSRLRFTTTFWNRGYSALELRTNQAIDRGRDATYDASQRLWSEDGSHRDRSVGSIYWHAPHDHFHYVNFADYTLSLVHQPSVGVEVPDLTQKTTFCMRDDVTVRVAPDGERQPRTYTGCNGMRQGVSVGWADVYNYSLPDQHFDVTGMPAGIYRLGFEIDPPKRFAEASRENNYSIALLDLDPSRNYVNVVAFASPFVTSWNFYPQGMLVRPDNDNKVYMVDGNRKRWIRDEATFLSYRRGWGEIHAWPHVLVDVIPDTRLIRQAGTNRIFYLKDGWKRYVTSPEVMASYGWTGGEVAEINEVEMAGYPTVDLVSLDGSADVWSISGKKMVGTTSEVIAQGHDSASIHVINQTDFNGYGF